MIKTNKQRLLTALLLLVLCLIYGYHMNARQVFAETRPSPPSERDYPKPKITSKGKEIRYAILMNSFQGWVTDRIGYYDVLITDKYTTLCGAGDVIQIDFGANKPDKLVMAYNPNTMDSSEQEFQKRVHRSYIFGRTEIENSFVIEAEHLHPVNKDVMYFLTASWANGDSLEYDFLITTDATVTPIRITDGMPVIAKEPEPLPPPVISGLRIEVDETLPTQPVISFRVSGVIVPPAVDFSKIAVIRSDSEFDAVVLNGAALENVITYTDGNELFLLLRSVAEALGCELSWSGETHSITITDKGGGLYFDSIELTVGSAKASLQFDGAQATANLVTEPVLIDNVTHITLKDFIDFFKINILSAENRELHLTTGSDSAQQQ